MHEQNAFEFLPFELELPGEDAGGDHRHRGNRRAQQIVVSHLRQGAPLGPLRQEIERSRRR